MLGTSHLPRIGLHWLAILACVVSGCALRVPAIDPTGQRIFLPRPAFTTIQSPLAGLHQTRPAFTEPPAIPPCPPAVVQPSVVAPQAIPAVTLPPVGQNLAAQQDRLILTPSRIVAPINSEVVLLAGICGPDGYYVTRQPIEFSLSQDSVGQFVDVGDTKHTGAHHLSQHGPRKLDSDFALARTSKVARRITRGTPSPNDDVWLRKGQAWLSLSSATQGISHVAAIAPGAENWEQRRQVARIHWVDAQWELPSPAVVRAGGTHTLTTRVTRSSSGLPVSDWTVRYEVTGGVPATFGSTQLTRIDQPTDANGAATVTVTPQVVQSGSTQIRISILSPADGDAPVEIGQGFTTIQWSAPGLAVSATGPEVGAPGATLVYRIEVSNPGDLLAENVRVAAFIPPTINYLNSEPPARQTGERVQWDLGSLSPGDTRSLELRCRAQRAGEIRLLIQADAGGLQQDATVRTVIEEAGLEVEMKDAPTTASVGETVSFNFTVTNVGRLPLDNVILEDRFDAGFEHLQGQANPIERSLGSLEVGESRPLAVSFIVRRPGRLCHTVTASADGGYEARATACLDAREADLRMEVSIEGQPARAMVGDEFRITLRVRNVGDAPLTRVRILDLPSTSLDPVRASRFYETTDEGALYWEIASIAPNDSETRDILCRCLSADANALNQLEVTTAEGLRDSATATTVIEVPRPPSSAVPIPVDPGGTPLGPRTGTLKFSVIDNPNRITVGDRTTMFIEVDNDQNQAVRNVELSFTLPAGLQFAASRPPTLPILEDTGGRYRLGPIAEIRAGGLRQIQIDVTGVAPGPQTFQVRIESPVIVEDSVTTQVLQR